MRGAKTHSLPSLGAGGVRKIAGRKGRLLYSVLGDHDRAQGCQTLKCAYNIPADRLDRREPADKVERRRMAEAKRVRLDEPKSTEMVWCLGAVFYFGRVLGRV